MDKLITFDIETDCGVPACEGKCKHPLDMWKQVVTNIGVYTDEESFVVKRPIDFYMWVKQQRDVYGYNPVLNGWNIKFDLRGVYSKGYDLREFDWVDAQLAYSINIEKVSQKYLEWYEKLREEKNKELPSGYSHRSAKDNQTGLPKNTLKLVAPAFLGIEPFWEDPTDHSSDEYVLKDCEYTHKLYKLFRDKLEKQDAFEFFINKAMPWAKTLLNAEFRGVKIDINLLGDKEKEAKEKEREYEEILNDQWKEVFERVKQDRITKLKEKYFNKCEKAVEKLKNKSKVGATRARYKRMFEEAKEKMDLEINFNSAPQLQEFFKHYLGLNIQNLDGKDSTEKEVLNRLVAEGRKDIEIFHNWRSYQKRATSFFPAYRDFQHDGLLHCNFNPSGTRTGRLSSSDPNLQQVPSDLHGLFRAREGYKLATYDESSIEPRLIAYFTECPVLNTLMQNNIKFHGYAAKILFPDIDCHENEVKKNYPSEYDLSKQVDLSLFYGSGPNMLQKISMNHGFNWSLPYCKEKFNNYREEFRGVYQFKEALDQMLEENKTIVTNLFGRPVHFNNKKDIFMKGFNTFIQGSASDLVQNSAYRMEKEFHKNSINAQPILFIHDEIVTEIPEKEEDKCVEIIEKSMTDYDLTNDFGRIKLEVEGQVSDTWVK